jgi:hypothetical protein
MFSIGVAKTKPFQGSKGPKGSKRPKGSKGPKGPKGPKSMASNLSGPYTRINDINQIFRFHTGPYWSLPSLFFFSSLSDSIKNKFTLVSHISNYDKLKKEIERNRRLIKFSFPSLKNLIYQPFKNEQIESLINSYYKKQEYDWEKVGCIYQKLFHWRYLLKPLIFRWRIAKCIKNVKNTEDPITLEIPNKPVIVIDIKKKISFVYEARSIRKAIENKILFSDYMFTEVQAPINILTNKPFKYNELLSVIQQCKKHGECSWILDDLKKYNCDLHLFGVYNRQRLNIEAIECFFKKSRVILRETVVDFFRIKAELCSLPYDKEDKFIEMYDAFGSSQIVERWIGLTREYYIAKELNNVELLMKNVIKTEILIKTMFVAF